MITAAASAFPYLRPSVTSVPAARRGAHGAAAVTCGYTAKVTIYNCRIFVAVSGQVPDGRQHSGAALIKYG